MKSCFVGDVVDAAHTEMVLHVEASEDIVGAKGNTLVAEVGMVVGHTSLDHVDHARKAKQLMQENWFAEYGKKLVGTALPPSEMPP